MQQSLNKKLSRKHISTLFVFQVSSRPGFFPPIFSSFFFFFNLYAKKNYWWHATVTKRKPTWAGALQNGVNMTWTQSHNAGQTLTYFKKLPKDTAGCWDSASLTLFGCPRGVSFSLLFKPFALFFHMKCKTKDISLFIPYKGYLDWVLNSPYFDFKLSFFAQAFE